MRLLRIRPIRLVLRWQGIVTVAFAAIAGLVAGAHGALSAALGGLVGIAATVVFAAVASLGGVGSAGMALGAMLRAEAAKIAAIVLLLWLVLATYNNVVVVWFIGSFLVCALLLSGAAAIREDR
jgi:ATP synthase protein I